MQSFYRVNQTLEQEKVGNKEYKSIYSTRTLRSYNKCAELIATIRIKHPNLLIKSFWVKPEFELNAVVSKSARKVVEKTWNILKLVIVTHKQTILVQIIEISINLMPNHLYHNKRQK